MQKSSRNLNVADPVKIGFLFSIFLIAICFAGSEAQTPCVGVAGASVQPPFNTIYSCVSLGSVSGVPISYGSLTLKYDDSNILLIGGAANGSTGRIYQIGVIRDGANHITGFSGTATLYPNSSSTVGQYNDGGVLFGPGNVLFVARYPLNQIEESKPGSSAPDKVIDLSTVSGGIISGSVGSLGFVPAGFPSAGQMKIVSYSSGIWYTAAFAADGSGTYDITSATAGPGVGSGPEGIAFVPPGSAVFAPNSVLIALYGANKIITAPLDSNSDPIMASAQDFITGLSGAEGAFIDPITGDFLFSTFGGGNQVVRVSGFLPTAAPVSVGGRVLTARGFGVSRARIILTDSNGSMRTATTNSFGFYRIEEVVTGQTYIVSVSAKGYLFQPRVLTINDEIANLDFTAEP